jgi:hypothetical protein
MTLFALVAGLLAGAAVAQVASPKYWSESQATTRAVSDPNSDTTPATSGMDLGGVQKFQVCIAAAAGDVLSGTGNVRAWYYDYRTARWAKNPGLDLSQDLATRRDRCWPTQDAFGYGRVLYAADTIGRTTGDGGTVLIDGGALTNGVVLSVHGYK